MQTCVGQQIFFLGTSTTEEIERHYFKGIWFRNEFTWQQGLKNTKLVYVIPSNSRLRPLNLLESNLLPSN